MKTFLSIDDPWCKKQSCMLLANPLCLMSVWVWIGTISKIVAKREMNEELIRNHLVSASLFNPHSNSAWHTSKCLPDLSSTSITIGCSVRRLAAFARNSLKSSSYPAAFAVLRDILATWLWHPLYRRAPKKSLSDKAPLPFSLQHQTFLAGDHARHLIIKQQAFLPQNA